MSGKRKWLRVKLGGKRKREGKRKPGIEWEEKKEEKDEFLVGLKPFLYVIIPV